jgi:hypothetical protein
MYCGERSFGEVRFIFAKSSGSGRKWRGNAPNRSQQGIRSRQRNRPSILIEVGGLRAASGDQDLRLARLRIAARLTSTLIKEHLPMNKEIPSAPEGWWCEREQ